MNWTYKGKEVTELPPGKIGFVYVTHYSDGSYYIGKKTAISNRYRPAIKKSIPENIVGRRITRDESGKIMTSKKTILAAKRRGCPSKIEKYECIYTEHKWQDYEGSSNIKDSYVLVAKEIVHWGSSKQAITYIEADLQFRTGSLFDERCLNMNILASFYPGVLDGEEISYINQQNK